ncbi:MAG TPA: hypothetical protein VMS17_02010 [Gemmataceae bacterium]|nr:hypothetical protein [Gemmataceae bacterium]
MNDDTLLGYLLDALDRDERRSVEAHLRGHPEAHARLKELGRLVTPLAADADAPEPPGRLVEATLTHIMAASCRQLPAAPPMPRQAGAPRRSLRRADLVVAGLILFVAAGLSAAWLGRQWHDYRVLACQNNLHKLWTALHVYNDQHPERGGAFPCVEAAPPHNFAGVFMSELADAGALGPDATTVCPARSGPAAAPCSLAELDAMARNQPCEYQARIRELGGDYAYTLGYRQGDDVVGLSRACGDLLPILADRPSDAGRGNSPNHGGAGQNVLYIGGEVRWCNGPNVGVDGDDIYRNLHFQVLAGQHEFDTVLGASDASPCLNP